MYLIVYILVVILILSIRKNLKYKVKPYPNLKIKDDGIFFTSNKRHRLNIGQARILQTGKVVHLQYNKIYIQIQNIDRIERVDNFLYYTGLGEVKIRCNMKRIKKYFNIYIESERLEVKDMQHKAKLSLINHLFNIQDCKELREYIAIIRILNIRLQDNKVVIGKNKYNIPFTLYYKVNNVIKKVIVV